MRNTLKRLLAQPTFKYFEGDDEAVVIEQDGATPKTFTQEDVNRLLAENKRNLQIEVAKKTAELQEKQSQITMSQEERDTLANQLQELNNIALTKEELAKRERTQLKQAAEAEAKALKANSDKWQKKHDDLLITHALTTAAVAEKAYNTQQIVDLFKGKTTISEDPTTSAMEVKVRVTVVGVDGRPTDLVLDPVAAMKEIASMESYANLFNFDTKGGLGKTKSKYKQERGSLPTSMDEYRANRDQIIKG